MSARFRLRGMASVCLLGGIVGMSVGAEVRLKYLGRQFNNEVVGIEGIGNDLALAGAPFGVELIDLNTLPAAGGWVWDDIAVGHDAYTTTTRADGYCYVNERLGGLSVLFVDKNAHTLTDTGTRISEPGVFYEKMSVVGDRLYVAAHSYGIRIFDLTDPANPVLIGSLDEGIDDAFAITVDGDTAYVADGAGGLKIVDLTDETTPVIAAGEDPASAAGTSEDVMVINGHVYVSAGGAGVAVYPLGQIAPRTLYDTPISAKHLALAGDHLAVADIRGFQVFKIAPDGTLSNVAGEAAIHGPAPISTRNWHAVSNWGDDRVLASAWLSADAYELVDPNADTQPDLTASVQRIRFAPAGGSQVVQLSNDGSGPLTITNISSSESSFTVTPQQAVIQPGDTLPITVEYLGVQPGEAQVDIESDDPDENPYPIRVFGDTQYLDPGELATPFTLESWTYDHDTDTYATGSFSLADKVGRIVFFHIYGSW